MWAARELGVEEDAIARGIERLEGVPGRFESVDQGQPFAVIVDYAHTPDSLVNVLQAARELGAGKLTVVFGAGGDRDREKRPLMGRAAAAHADRAIVTTDGEHFGMLGALAVSPARVRVAKVRELPPEDALDVLLGEVTPRTRLLALSQVCWMSGNRFPAAELKEVTGLPVLVDGAQSAGAIAVDASRFDFYAFSCQKWLCGPDGTGGLVVADPERLGIAAPSYLSQESYEPEGEFVARPGAARFDPGWTPPPSLAGLSAALDLAPDGHFERAAQMAARCRELLAERFDVVTAPDQATLVSFRAEGDSAELVKRLYEHGVVVRDVPKLGWIRVSCGWWTSEEDLARLLGAL